MINIKSSTCEEEEFTKTLPVSLKELNLEKLGKCEKVS